MQLGMVDPELSLDLAGAHTQLGIQLAKMGKRDRALKEHQQARDIRSKLVKDHPEVLAYRVHLGGSCCNVGHLHRMGGKPQQAVADYSQAILLLQDVHQRQPSQLTARLFLRNSHWGRAMALVQLGRHRDAVADWDEVIRLEADASARQGFRLRRADSLARAGDHRRAAAVDDLGQGESVSGATLYDLAGIQAINAARAARDASRPLAEREKRVEQYARAAIAFLNRAASTGQFRHAANVAALDRNADLAFLRDRDDYKRFRAGLQPPG
jgi:tetratricopeptide (TPR) repeat protein